MKKLLLSLFAGIGSLSCLAQKPLYLKNASYLEYLNIPKSEKPFVGGLSAIEYNPEDGSWSVVSDRDNTGKNSYIFHPDLEDGNLNGKNWKKSVVADLVDVESYRGPILKNCQNRFIPFQNCSTKCSLQLCENLNILAYRR